jgi:hypothetical protein
MTGRISTASQGASPVRAIGVALIGLVAIAVAGCGSLQPTPARFRPPLPDPDLMPGTAVEEVVEELELLGYGCRFEPESDIRVLDVDIQTRWSCVLGDREGNDTSAISLVADEAGPIERVTVYRQIVLGPDTGPDPEVLDREGLAAFRALVDLIVPEEQRPSDDELLTSIQRNFPMELDRGWVIGFDQNVLSRTMYVVFAGDE